MAQALQERIKQGRENAQGRRSSIITAENIPLWRPKDGEHIIDIIPYFAGPNDKDKPEGKATYTFEYLVHKGVGPSNAWYLCLLEMYNKPCPICEHRMKLREQGADDEIWKALFPKKMNMYNIICYDRGEEEKGIQIWDVPWFYSEKHILSISKKRGRGKKSMKSLPLVNFADPENGKSISFVIEPAQSRNDYPTYTGFAFEDRDYEIEEETIESTYVLDSDELIHIPKFDEVKKAYWGSREESDQEVEKLSRRSRHSSKPEPENNEPDINIMIEELEDCADIDELNDFSDEYGFDLDEFDMENDRRSNRNKVRRTLRKMIHEMHEPEEDEESEEEEVQEYAWGDIKKMSKVKLKRLIKSEELDIDPDEAEDLEDLQEMVADELDIAF